MANSNLPPRSDYYRSQLLKDDDTLDDDYYNFERERYNKSRNHSRGRQRDSRSSRQQIEDGDGSYYGYRQETAAARHSARLSTESPRVEQIGQFGMDTTSPSSIPIKTGWDSSLVEQERYQSYASLGIGFASLVAETLLSHPCIVLRRQCQIMNNGISYHLTPVTLLPIIYNLHRSQGIACLWKGIGSVFIIRGFYLMTENIVSELSNWPKEVNRHSSSKKLMQNICLKFVSYSLVAPFYAASLVETVQSEIASDNPGVIEFLKEGASRLIVMSTPTASSNLLAIWKLVPPVALLGVSAYALKSLASYATVRYCEPAHSARQHQPNPIAQVAEFESDLHERFHSELMASFIGSAIADALLFPLETVANRLCAQGTRVLIDNMDTGTGVASLSSAYSGPIDALVSITRQETGLGLYRGFGALVLQFAAHLCLLHAATFAYKSVINNWAPNPNVNHNADSDADGDEDSFASDLVLSSDPDEYVL